MKKIPTFLLSCLLILSSTVFSQEDCNPYYVLTEGKSWTIKTYSAKKDKLESTQTYKVIAAEELDGKLVVTVNLIALDKKDEEVLNKHVTFECEDGVVNMDLSSMMPPEMLESFKSMDIKMEMERMSIPKSLTVGQKLDDGSMKMTMNGPVDFSMGFVIKDRLVESKESINVPAGDFEAYKISYITAYSGIGSREIKGVEYIAEGLGLVRSESYNNKGELDTYSVLVSFTN